MAVVQSGIFSNPGVGFATNPSGTPDPNGPRGGISDDEWPNLNGQKQSAKTIDMSMTNSRLSQAKLDPGGGQQQVSAQPDSPVEPSVGFTSPDKDWRVRVSVHPASSVLYRDPKASLLSPLWGTDGVIFPYVPTLGVSHAAKYNTTQLTHSNYTNYFYESSEVQAISINGEFSAQTEAEASYVLAVIYFFRAATKMFYGNSGKYQGSPPPILYLDGFGAHYLPHVPCLLTQFNHTMPNTVDYIELNIPGGSGAPLTPGTPNLGNQMGSSFVRIPTLSSISISLQPIYSRARQKEFNFDAFARGEQLNKGFL